MHLQTLSIMLLRGDEQVLQWQISHDMKRAGTKCQNRRGIVNRKSTKGDDTFFHCDDTVDYFTDFALKF